MKRIYKYFRVKNGKVIGRIISTFRIKAPDIIELTDHNEHLFHLHPDMLTIENGKILVMKSDNKDVGDCKS